MIQLVLKDWSLKGLVLFRVWRLGTELLCAFDQTKKVVALCHGLSHKAFGTNYKRIYL